MAQQLTVRELKEQLDALPDEFDELPVELEGCDCRGECIAVSDQYTPKYILLERNP